LGNGRHASACVVSRFTSNDRGFDHASRDYYPEKPIDFFEFVLTLPKTSCVYLLRRVARWNPLLRTGRSAPRIQAALIAPFMIESQHVYTAASIGIVMSCAGYAAPDDILRDADLAMYRAKSLGGASGNLTMHRCTPRRPLGCAWKTTYVARYAAKKLYFIISRLCRFAPIKL
jgi:GGDEF domain-containing protein